MCSECSRFHPNRFTFGEVIAERVNNAETRRKGNPIIGFEAIKILNLKRIQDNGRPQFKKNLLNFNNRYYSPTIQAVATKFVRMMCSC